VASPTDRPSLDLSNSGRFGGLGTSTFTLTASGGSFNIGDFYTLTVPANAVCVLSSSYGPGTWDQSCETLGAGQRVQVTATYGFANGGPVVDFKPDLRFNPNTPVTLSTSMYASILTTFRGFYESNPSALRYFGIYYTEDMGVSGQTDAALDPSLATHINLRTGLVWRRIKHFSGYNVATGMPCEPSPNDPNCVETNPVIERH